MDGCHRGLVKQNSGGIYKECQRQKSVESVDISNGCRPSAMKTREEELMSWLSLPLSVRLSVSHRAFQPGTLAVKQQHQPVFCRVVLAVIAGVGLCRACWAPGRL